MNIIICGACTGTGRSLVFDEEGEIWVYGEEECDACGGSGRIEEVVMVTTKAHKPKKKGDPVE